MWVHFLADEIYFMELFSILQYHLWKKKLQLII